MSFAGPANAVAYLDARYRTVSEADCVDATRMIAELAPAPLNATYLRVQHVGDPSTAELAGEIANVVTWDVGALSGLHVPVAAYAQSQRGYRDLGPPDSASAFQLWCDGAGFVLDSRRFAHASPLTLEGPSVSVARDLAPPAAIFGNATSALTIEARVRVPRSWTATPPQDDGTAQVSFFYYATDATSGATFAHVIGLFDNRPAGTGGAGGEALAADAYTAFVGSPLADGARYVTRSPVSAAQQLVAGWTEPRLFRAHVTYAQFEAMLAELGHTALPGVSLHPEDWRITSFGVLGEIFPGTGSAHEVALGASVTGLSLSEASYDIAAAAVVEFYNAALDHYFVSARQDDVEALDSGRLPGWRRTGASFGAYPAYVAGLSPVCRFYLPPASGDSHFFSASPDECAAVATAFPDFVLEDARVMFVDLPAHVSGTCPAGRVPLYRLWNAKASTNHRYTTSLDTRAAMLAAGWVPEGYGPLGVAMCTPQLP